MSYKGLVIILIVLVSFASTAFGGQCVTKEDNGSQKCLDRKDVPKKFVSYVQWITEDGSCFSYPDGPSKPHCFINKSGSTRLCDCDISDCGCAGKDATKPKDSNGNPLPNAPKDAGPAPPPVKEESKGPITCTADSQNFTPMCGEGYGEDNSMCIYKSMGSSCGQVCSRGLTEEEKKIIVDRHNELRRYVAKGQESKAKAGAMPQAANMHKLVWDDELAVTAQRWTDQCKIGHDKNRRTPHFEAVGQNMAWSSYSNAEGVEDVLGLMQGWYNEVKDFPPGNTQKFSLDGTNGRVVTHFTQFVCANVTKIGCGLTMFKKGNMYQKDINCNYAGAGCNMMKQPVYEVGTPGSKCEGQSEDGLCI